MNTEKSAASDSRLPTEADAVEFTASALLDAVLESSQHAPSAGQQTGTAAPVDAGRWLRMALAGCEREQLQPEEQASRKRRAKNRLGAAIAAIDQIVSAQVNEILHHPRFQSLEASWRGLWQLVEQVDLARTVPLQVRVLSLTRRQWVNDLLNSTTFDSSVLFRLIYEEEFGMPGGTPYGLLVNDFEIGRSIVDWDVLESLAEVAAAAFCPTVMAPSPSLLGLDSWNELPFTQQITAGFRSPEYARWNRFRKSDDAKYIGLTLPRVLMRLPHCGSETSGFIFKEDVSEPHGRHYLWGSAAYAFASVVIRSFSESRWLADIRGAERGVLGGGIVTSLPKHQFSTDREGVGTKSSVDVMLTDPQEAELSTLGFLPLSHCPGTEYSAFYSSWSLQEPKKYSDPLVTANARIGAMLQYTLCVSRFAHYIKVIARDWVGSGKESVELQRYLDRWLKQYVADSSGLSNEVRAQRPLRKAEVAVQRHPMQPGTFQCSIDLWPHYQVDQLSASVQLKTTIVNNTSR